MKKTVAILLSAFASVAFAEELVETSRRILREDERPMNFCFARRFPDGTIYLSHSIGRHAVDERTVNMFSPDDGRTWRKDGPIGGMNAFLTKDGRKRFARCWDVVETNRHLVTVTTLGKDGKLATQKTELAMPEARQCLLHRDVARLRNGKLLLTGYCRNPKTKKCDAFVIESVDDGMNWRYVSTLPEVVSTQEGINEATVVQVKDGSVQVYARGGNKFYKGECFDLLRFVSRDEARTWDAGKVVADYGVDPQAQILSDGTLALLSGRPGLYLMLDRTGTGDHFVRHEVFSGMGSSYATLMEIAPGKLLIIYDDSSMVWFKGDHPTNRIMAVTYDYRVGRASCESGKAEIARTRSVDRVDPFIGCAFNGHTFCAAAYPAGFVQAGPDTGNRWWDYCGGFRYEDERIIGFSQTHISGAGDAEMGDVMVMPFTGAFDLTRTNWASAYDRETFVARPGYCAVTLTENRVRVESTVTQRAAIHRLTYQGAAPRHLLVDLAYAITQPHTFRILDCELAWNSDREFSGRILRHSYLDRECAFFVRFDHPVVRRTDLPRVEKAEKAPRFVLDFDLPPGEPLMMKVGISSVDAAGARNNIDAEIPDWDLERVRAAADRAWDATLSRMTAEGPADALTNFYTSLYHLFLQPYDMTDADGRFRRADGSIGQSRGQPFYTMFSCWDTFRAAHPLYTLVAPERIDAFCESLVEHWRRRGFLPQNWVIWGFDNQSMIATHSVPILVDAFLKGFSGPQGGWEEAWRAIADTLGNAHPQRRKEQWDVMEKYGYLPLDLVRGETVSRTLENCYDDACAARLGAALGHEAEAERFRRRSLSWTNLFDRATGFMRGRDSKGNWRTPFDPRRAGVGPEGGRNDYTEGNAWQYSWHVMQDPTRLIALHGGKEAFVRKLDGLFRAPERAEGDRAVLDMTGLIGMYAHGNEPSHHIIYFYPFADAPWRTAELVREVFDRLYLPKPDGLCGNEDCGQMSAWYLFSAMGFYPFDPCGGDYVLGAPQLPKIVLRLPQGKRFTVVAKNLSKENKYVKSVTLNGKPLAGFVLRHADVVAGGELVFEMCATGR